MKDKNVRCVKVLLCLALTDGNLLRESWGLVLRCISQLSRYGFHLIPQHVFSLCGVCGEERVCYGRCFHRYRLPYLCGFEVVRRLFCDFCFACERLEKGLGGGKVENIHSIVDFSSVCGEIFQGCVWYGIYYYPGRFESATIVLGMVWYGMVCTNHTQGAG